MTWLIVIIVVAVINRFDGRNLRKVENSINYKKCEK